MLPHPNVLQAYYVEEHSCASDLVALLPANGIISTSTTFLWPIRPLMQANGLFSRSFMKTLLGAWCETRKIIFQGSQPRRFQGSRSGVLGLMHQVSRGPSPHLKPPRFFSPTKDIARGDASHTEPARILATRRKTQDSRLCQGRHHSHPFWCRPPQDTLSAGWISPPVSSLFDRAPHSAARFAACTPMARVPANAAAPIPRPPR